MSLYGPPRTAPGAERATLPTPGCWWAWRRWPPRRGVEPLTGAWNAVENAAWTPASRCGPCTPARPADRRIDDPRAEAMDLRWPSPARSTPARSKCSRGDARTMIYDLPTCPNRPPKPTGTAFSTPSPSPQRGARHQRSRATGLTTLLGGAGGPASAHAQRHGGRQTSRRLERRRSSSTRTRRRPSSRRASRNRRNASEREDGVAQPFPSPTSSASIDFPGRVGTVPSVSFVDLVDGRVSRPRSPARSSSWGPPALGWEIHATSVTSSTGMSARKCRPLRSRPRWPTTRCARRRCGWR